MSVAAPKGHGSVGGKLSALAADGSAPADGATAANGGTAAANGTAAGSSGGSSAPGRGAAAGGDPAQAARTARVKTFFKCVKTSQLSRPHACAPQLADTCGLSAAGSQQQPCVRHSSDRAGLTICIYESQHLCDCPVLTWPIMNDSIAPVNISFHYRERLDVAPSDETRAYVQFLVPRALEPRLPGFLEALERSAPQLGVTDIQIALSQLEEVFLRVALQVWDFCDTGTFVRLLNPELYCAVAAGAGLPVRCAAGAVPPVDLDGLL